MSRPVASFCSSFPMLQRISGSSPRLREVPSSSCQSQPLQHIFLRRKPGSVACLGSITGRSTDDRLSQCSSRHICSASSSATVLGEDRAKPTDTPAAAQDCAGVDASSDEELELSMPEPAILDTRVPDLLASGKEDMSLADIEGVLPFQLDRFQAQAIDILLQGSSVVVSAPTGAGKTVIAEAATLAVLARGQRVVYTTPLKALSNQKLFEMRLRFGAPRVGLQTGDATLNVDRDIVVMTTEILRNIMYRTEPGTEGVSQAQTRLADVGMIVLDEVHYLGDPSRGSVWEEVIINCPKHIQLCAMSATVANADALGGWIDEVHGKCKTVVTKFRPVPLSWQFCYQHEDRARLLPLLAKKGRALNPELQPPSSDNYMGVGWGRFDKLRSAQLQDEKAGEPQFPFNKPRWQRMPKTPDIVAAMHKQRMLPAIFFIFSRAACDDNATRLSVVDGICLTRPEERKLIGQEIARLRQEQPEAVKETLVGPLLNGLASHHAGLLPGWKSLVESLFQQGVLKVVFATETLAAGINMPARSTVISALSRRRDRGIAALTHNELLQMAGRAGRRGFDTQGYCVVLQSKFEDAEDAQGIIARGPEALQSQFSSGFGMVLNLLHTRSMEAARAFVQRSFDNYLGTKGTARALEEIQLLEERGAALAAEADEAEALHSSAGDPMTRHEKAVGTLREETRALRLLTQQAVEERAEVAARSLAALGIPRTVGLDLSADRLDMGQPLPALLVAEVDSLAAPELDFDQNQTRYLCLSSDNRLLQVRLEQIAAVMEGDLGGEGGPAASTIMAVADAARMWNAGKGGAYYAPGTPTTAVLAARIAQPQYIALMEVSPEMEDALDAAEARVAVAKKEADKSRSAAAQRQSVRQDMRLRAKALAHQRRGQAMREALDKQQTSSWREFQAVASVLIAAGALEPDTYRATSLGEVARQVSGENELWLATALTHAALQDLAASQLAGVACALIAAESASRPAISAAYEPSQPVCHAIEALEADRERLYNLQLQAGVAQPLNVDLRLSGVVEAWAGGSAWDQIVMDCNLDDGDIARLLNRTMDLLKQIRHCDALPPGIRREARLAVKAMNRTPISDLIA